MNLKLYTILTSALLVGGTAIAQDYHGFRINASQELIDNVMGNPLSAQAYEHERAIVLVNLFQPEYRPVMANETLTDLTWGTTVTGDAVPCTNKKCMDYACPETTSSGQKKADESIADADINGLVLTPEMGADGLAYLTVPSECYINGVMTPVEGGDILIRICTESGDKGRLGDSENCRVDDITGVFMTVSAPATATITSNFCQANTTTTFSAPGLGSENEVDALGHFERQAVFEMPSVTTANVPQDIKFEGKAKSSYNLFTYKRKQDAYGFPIRFVEIVFKGLKAGEKVGWTNYQTLHDGYTPNAYTGAGVESAVAGVDNAPVEYFNLQGVRVANPENGFYIKRQGAKATKVLVK